MRNWSTTVRRTAAVATVAAAFGFGMALGDLSWSERFATRSEASAVARYFVPEPKAAVERVEQPKTATANTKRRLRLRSTSVVSSEKARPGDPVMFLTEQLFEDMAGNQIPAGSLVEAVVAQATSSHDGLPGKLVIEIRSLHVGNAEIPLRAAPYRLETKNPAANSLLGDLAPALAGRRFLKSLPTGEAVVAQETVLEFELIEREAPAAEESVAPVKPAVPEADPEQDRLQRNPTRKAKPKAVAA